MLCLPCGAVRRGLLHQCAGDKKSKEAMHSMMRDDPVKFRQICASCRVKPQGESPEIPGVQTVNQRKEMIEDAVATFIVTFQRTHGSRAVAGLMSLSKKRFLAFRKNIEGDTEEEAQALWDWHMNTGENVRFWNSGHDEVICSDIPKLEAFQEQSERRTVRTPELSIANDADRVRIANQMSFDNFNLADSLSQSGSIGGELFLEANHAGNALAFPKSSNIAPCNTLPALQDLPDPLNLVPQRSAVQCLQDQEDQEEVQDDGEEEKPWALPRSQSVCTLQSPLI